MTKKHSVSETLQFEKKIKKLKKEKTEEALRESEEKFHLLLESSDDPIYLIDKELKYLYANQKLLSRYRKTLSEVIGQTYANFHSPAATVLFSNRVKEVLKSGKPLAYEYKSRRDGKDFLRTLNPVINRSVGEITAITVISKDITEQKQMARALEKSEEKLRNFIDSSTIGIWCFRLESPVDIKLPKEKMIKAFFKAVCVECNETYAVMMGTTKDEILGTVLYEVMPDTEENRAYLEAFIHNNFRISGGISHEIGKNGLEKYFSNSMVGTIKNRKLIEAWGTQTDITEREQAEKNLQFLSSISEQVTDSIVVTDTDFNITYVNRATEKLYGYSKKELLGKTPDILNVNSHRTQIQENIYITVSSGETWTGEHLNRKKNGSTFICEFKISPLKDVDDNILAYIAIQRDCTERKEAKRELEIQKIYMEELFESAPEAITILDNKDRVQKINREFTNLFGYSSSEAIGCKINDLIVPADLKAEGLKATADVAAGERVSIETIRQNKDGQRIYVSILGHPIKIEGDQLAVYGIYRDITEHKQAEEALRESEEKYRTLIENEQDGVFLIQDNQIKFGNPAFASMIGYTTEEIIGKDFRDFIAPEDRDMVADRYRRRQAGEDLPSKYEIRSLHKDGKTRIDVFISVGLLNYRGKVASIGTLHNITERKRSENQIRLLTAQIEKFSKISADILSIRDDKELFNTISTAIVEISDFSRVMFYTFKEDFPFRDILGSHGIDKETIERLQKVGISQEELKEIFNKGISLGNQSCYVPHTMKHILDQKAVDNGKKEYAPGAGRWHKEDNLFIALKDETGDFIGMISVDDSKSGDIPTDETVRPLEMFANHISQILQSRKLEKKIRASEEQYRLLVENVNDAIVISQQGKFIYYNKQFATMLRYDYDELLLKDFTEVHTEKAVEILMERQARRNRGEYVASRYETIFKKKDGKPIDVEANVSIIEYRGDKATFAVIRDVTERKRIEKEAHRNQNLESIGILAGGIAHDFNNILTIILGNITLSKMYANPEDKVYKRLVEAEKGAMRAKDLTQQLLTFSKGGAPVKEASSVAEFLKESAAFALSGSNVKCIFSIPDDIWAVEIDKGQINQVFNNLVMNADQAMPEGGIIKISAENITITPENVLPLQQGQYIKFSFEDHGIGIPAHHLDKIFDPYFSTKTKGSGLGLASAYSIIRNHNGLITVESGLGAGTTFYIYLPASEEIVIKKESKNGKTLFGKGKILIMDDEEFVREVAGEMVRSLGYSAEFAKDGAEAIELYKKALKSEEPFSAVIMDLTTPGGMGGKEAIRELLKIDPEVKAIVSSGYSNDPIMSDCKKYGFVGVVAKPYKISELGKTLKEIILE
ncbi:MAG: PAS domain S-box protein [Candidatus Marinimicrobia bacterium]|nr:PAS domain S-box protein [Candidatus Neomarinimicrobiota bacterium]